MTYLLPFLMHLLVPYIFTFSSLVTDRMRNTLFSHFSLFFSFWISTLCSSFSPFFFFYWFHYPKYLSCFNFHFTVATSTACTVQWILWWFFFIINPKSESNFFDTFYTVTSYCTWALLSKSWVFVSKDLCLLYALPESARRVMQTCLFKITIWAAIWKTYD